MSFCSHNHSLCVSQLYSSLHFLQSSFFSLLLCAFWSLCLIGLSDCPLQIVPNESNSDGDWQHNPGGIAPSYIQYNVPHHWFWVRQKGKSEFHSSPSGMNIHTNVKINYSWCGEAWCSHAAIQRSLSEILVRSHSFQVLSRENSIGATGVVTTPRYSYPTFHK